MIGIVIPAHNEEVLLPACLRAAQVAATHPLLHGEEVAIVVVLDCCSDRSSAIAETAGVNTVVVDARNVGVARAKGARHTEPAPSVRLSQLTFGAHDDYWTKTATGRSGQAQRYRHREVERRRNLRNRYLGDGRRRHERPSSRSSKGRLDRNQAAVPRRQIIVLAAVQTRVQSRTSGLPFRPAAREATRRWFAHPGVTGNARLWRVAM